MDRNVTIQQIPTTKSMRQLSFLKPYRESNYIFFGFDPIRGQSIFEIL